MVSGILSSISSGLSSDARRPALDESFNFGQRGHAGVAGGGHGQRAVGHTTADSPVDGLAREQAVDDAGSKAVAAAYSVQDVDIALGNVNNLVLIKRNRAPGVAAGGVRGAQGARDELQVGDKPPPLRAASLRNRQWAAFGEIVAHAL